MFTVTVIDTLSGDIQPQCVETHERIWEARDAAALFMDEVAEECTTTAGMRRFEKAADDFRAATAPITLTVDGFTVAITATA